MRGLTQLERVLLCAPIGYTTSSEIESVTLKKLVVLGRMKVGLSPRPNHYRYLPTDLGILAIRVCPKEE